MRHAPARSEQTHSPLTIGQTVRKCHLARVGTVVKTYSDGSVSVRWHDEPSDVHDRVQRALLTVVNDFVADAISANDNGVSVLHPGFACVLDYVEMRSAQLCALLSVVEGNEFRSQNDDVQQNVLWLAQTLSDEIAIAIPLVAKEAR